MAEQQRENGGNSRFDPSRQLVMTDLAYLADPGLAFERMRHGVEVIIQPTNGCARMTLSATLLSDVQLDD